MLLIENNKKKLLTTRLLFRIFRHQILGKCAQKFLFIEKINYSLALILFIALIISHKIFLLFLKIETEKYMNQYLTENIVKINHI